MGVAFLRCARANALQDFTNLKTIQLNRHSRVYTDELAFVCTFSFLYSRISASNSDLFGVADYYYVSEIQ